MGRRGYGLAVRHYVYVDVGGAAGWMELVLGVGLAGYRWWTWIDKPVVDILCSCYVMWSCGRRRSESGLTVRSRSVRQ